ncbi:MAG: DUF1801 domain-containing protein [Acidobacteria bacterium]|nr:DUF1801 domain-containing protein [Acidobacteriota bacterium]
MAKAELKTKKTEMSVDDFIDSVADETQRDDCRKLVALMQRMTGEPPRMWGPNIVGFGHRLLKYSSGRELDWMKVAFSPRKANLTLYLTTGTGWRDELLQKLGKHKTGKGCLYIKKMSDVDEAVLEQVIAASIADMDRIFEEPKEE